MKAKYSAYIYKHTKEIWILDHTTNVMFDSYDIKKSLPNALKFINRAVKNGLIKHAWSTDSQGKYL